MISEEKRKYMEGYYKKNSKRIAAYYKKYYRLHAAKMKATSKKAYEANKDKPEFKEKRKVYIYEYSRRPYVRAKKRAYDRLPKVKAHRRRYYLFRKEKFSARYYAKKAKRITKVTDNSATR